MRVADAKLHELAGRFGTPLYVYDLDEIAERSETLQRLLPPGIDVAFAVKANPSLAVLALFAELGVGADVASGGELEAVRRAGVDAGSVVFTGPGKRDDELEAAVCADLRAITVESLGELQRLRQIARRHDRRVPVLLRAAGTAADDAGQPIIGSGAGKFGIRAADLLQAAGQAARAPELELLGLHAFHASNVLDAEVLLAHAERTMATAAELARRTGVRFRLVDIGGGLGIPYAEGAPTLDIDRLGRGLGSLLARWREHPSFDQLRLLVEPGRHLVGPAGMYLSRVIDVKRSDRGFVAIIDGGVHHLLRPALIGEQQRVRMVPVSERASGGAPVTIAGPLCTGLDVLCHDARLPLPEGGDLVCVLDSGAYGFSESMPLFLSHPTPAEVVLQSGVAQLARPRIEPRAFIDQQHWGSGMATPPGRRQATARRRPDSTS